MKGLGFRVPFPDTERSVNRGNVVGLRFGSLWVSVAGPLADVYTCIYIYMYTHTKSQNGAGSKTWQ